jgi:hypothetical protein
MWNISPDYLQRTKDELKGRQAAIQALIAKEVKALDADIEEVETVERLAYAFAAKHLPTVEAEAEAEMYRPSKKPVRLRTGFAC